MTVKQRYYARPSNVPERHGGTVVEPQPTLIERQRNPTEPINW